jgi:lipopolysaccharide export system permease protein
MPRVALIDRYLAREILLPFGAGVLFLTQLFLATLILGQARVLFGSGASVAEVAAVVVCLVPNILSYVVPISFLLGAILGAGRLAEDREVIALGAAGISPVRLVRVPLALGLVLAAVTLWLALEVEPAGLRAARLRMNAIVARSVTSDVRGGTFYDQIPGYTIYVGGARKGTWERVLIHDRTDPGGAFLAVAKRAHVEPVGREQEVRVVLESGQMHRDEPDSDEYVVADFSRGELVLGLAGAVDTRSTAGSPSRELTLSGYADRIADARRRGDALDVRRWESNLHRKLASALAVIPFALLAVPLGVGRRGGRALAVSATVLVMVVEYVLLRAGQALAQRGALPPTLGLELGNLAIGAAALALLAALHCRGPGVLR